MISIKDDDEFMNIFNSLDEFKQTPKQNNTTILLHFNDNTNIPQITSHNIISRSKNNKSQHNIIIPNEKKITNSNFNKISSKFASEMITTRSKIYNDDNNSNNNNNLFKLGLLGFSIKKISINNKLLKIAPNVASFFASLKDQITNKGFTNTNTKININKLINFNDKYNDNFDHISNVYDTILPINKLSINPTNYLKLNNNDFGFSLDTSIPYYVTSLNPRICPVPKIKNYYYVTNTNAFIAPCKVDYIPLVTQGNDPTITTAVRIAQILNSGSLGGNVQFVVNGDANGQRPGQPGGIVPPPRNRF